MHGPRVRTFHVIGDSDTLRAVVDILGPCFVNVWDTDIVCSFDDPVSLASIAHLSPEPCPPPYPLAAPSAAVLRDGWLTPNDPDRALWETSPLSGRVQVCDGLVRRLNEEWRDTRNLRVHANRARWEGTPQRVFQQLASLGGTSVHLRVTRIEGTPQVQTTLARYFSPGQQAT